MKDSSWEKYIDRARFDFLYPRAPLHSDVKTEITIAQSDAINSFAQRVTTISNLVIGGKINTEEGMERIKQLYKELKKTNKSITN